jgi:hypothetical protein
VVLRSHSQAATLLCREPKAHGPLHAKVSTLFVCLISLIHTGTAQTATLRVGPSQPINRIADAARLAKDGDIVEIHPGEYRGDVATWTQNNLTLRGIGKRPTLIADGKSAEDKAIWVMKSPNAKIENIEFRGAHVRDRNGAGIRHERGNLTISNCAFIDNQNGLITTNHGDLELTIRDSLFAQASPKDMYTPHLLYVGRIKRLEITGSRFHQGYQHHLIKSRARANNIRYNLIYDGPKGTASYEIDLPNGGLADIVGNVIGQSANTQNPVLIAYGAEGNTWPENHLRLSHNTLISDRISGGWFLRVWKEKFTSPPKIEANNNLLVGVGFLSMGINGEFKGNFPAYTGMLGDPDILDFTLAENSILRGRVKPQKEKENNQTLTPEYEFNLPLGTTPLAPPSEWVPGAFQRGH